MDTSDSKLVEPKRFGRATRLLADLAYPSSEPTQYLSDVHLANADAADARPTGRVPVRYNYPRTQSLMPSIFEERPSKRIFRLGDSVLVQQYCDGVHWHNFALFGPEKMGYYWDPIGGKLSRRDPILKAFVQQAPSDWDLESISLVLQADGHSCGDWAHWFRCRARVRE